MPVGATHDDHVDVGDESRPEGQLPLESRRVVDAGDGEHLEKDELLDEAVAEGEGDVVGVEEDQPPRR